MRGVGRIKVALALLVFALGAASVVARVSSSPTSTAPASATGTTGTTAVDPCTLVTKAEAEAALRQPVSVVENPGQCTFVAADLSGRSLAVATPAGLPGPEYLEAAMQQLATALKGEVRTATGGDQSFIVISSDMSELMGVKGETYVAVVLTLSKDTPDAQAATLTDLAAKAFSRL